MGSRMIVLDQTETFLRWLARLKDARGKAAILSRIQRLARGDPGDAVPVGDGIREMRIRVGPGYRVHFLERDPHLIVLLAGGDDAPRRPRGEAAKQAATDTDP